MQAVVYARALRPLLFLLPPDTAHELAFAALGPVEYIGWVRACFRALAGTGHAANGRIATRVMGLEVAGVDMLETREGPKILEINSSPGLEGIERARGIDVAVAIIMHAERHLTRRRHKKSRMTLDDERRLSRLRAVTPIPMPARRRAGLNGA